MRASPTSASTRSPPGAMSRTSPRPSGRLSRSTEAATRLADRPDPVPDDVWDNAARHYDEPQLAALVLAIAAINTWNRLNVATRQISGEWVGEWVARRRRTKRQPDPGGGSAAQGSASGAGGAARQEPMIQRGEARRGLGEIGGGVERSV